MEAELAALAASGATTLVGLMVSESWERAKSGLARFFGRGAPGEAAEAELQAAPGRRATQASRQMYKTGGASVWKGYSRRIPVLLRNWPSCCPSWRQTRPEPSSISSAEG